MFCSQFIQHSGKLWIVSIGWVLPKLCLKYYVSFVLAINWTMNWMIFLSFFFFHFSDGWHRIRRAKAWWCHLLDRSHIFQAGWPDSLCSRHLASPRRRCFQSSLQRRCQIPRTRSLKQQLKRSHSGALQPYAYIIDINYNRNTWKSQSQPQKIINVFLVYTKKNSFLSNFLLPLTIFNNLYATKAIDGLIYEGK